MLFLHSEPTVASVFAPRTTIDADGKVEGYASLFGEIDQARDMVMPGAFAETLRKRGLRRIPMLFQHDPAEPIGVWFEMREDFRGLWARGKLIPDVQRAREVLALVKTGAIDGLSIGFRTVKGRIDPKTRVRRLEAIDLWEVSIVTFPLLNGARVRSVKGITFSYRRREEGASVNGAAAARLSPQRARAEAEWRKLFGARPGQRVALGRSASHA